MKVRTGGRTIEIPDSKVLRGTAIQPTASVGMPQLPGYPKSTDKWNYAFAGKLDMDRQAGHIKFWWYEPFSFWLVPPSSEKKSSGVRHKVDFMVWRNDGSMQMIEVKGHSGNLRDGMTRFKIAREKYPCFEWLIVKRDKGGWEEIKA